MSLENGILNSLIKNSSIIFEGSETQQNDLENLVQQVAAAYPPNKLTHTLHWANEDSHAYIEPCIISEHKHRKLQPPLELKNELITQRRLQSFISKVSKATKDGTASPEPLRKSYNKISQWIAEGYTTLEVLNEKKKGFPWDQIVQAPHPAIMEQLIVLYKLLDSPAFQASSAQEFIMHQAIIIGKQPSLPFVPEEIWLQSLDHTLKELGKLIFAADKAPDALVAQINKYKGKHLSQWLDKFFFKEIESTKAKLAMHTELHKKSGLQPDEIASKIQTIKEISHLLLLGDANINFGIIDLLIDAFISQESPPDAYDQEIITRLPLIKCNPRLRQEFSNIDLPRSTDSPAALIIRSLLPYSSKKLTKREVVLAAMTSFLTHLRQGNSGSCFSIFLAINMLAARPQDCLRDFAALVHEGALTRYIDGVSVQFPFTSNYPAQSVNKHFTLSSSGEIRHNGQSGGFIWEAPGLKAAAQIMNIQDLETVIKTVLEPISTQWTIDSLLKKLAATPNDYQNGLLFFEAQISNPLLVAWENTIANMAETNLSGITKTTVTNAAFNSIAEHLQKTNPTLSKSTLEQFFPSFYDEFTKSTRMLYDQALVNPTASQDQKSTHGGFVLYDRNGSSSPKDWIRIDTPLAYQEFIGKVALAAVEKIENKGSRIGTDKAHLINKLNNYLPTNDFLIDAIKNTNQRNSKIANPLLSINELDYLPWLVRGGNNPRKILKVYFETNKLPNYEKFIPESAQRLLEKIISLAKSASSKPHFTDGSNPLLITPVRTPGLHSFSLMLGHPSLTKAFELGENPKQWIQNSVLHVGSSIADSSLDNQIKLAICGFCIKKVLPVDKTEEFLSLYEKIPANLTIKEFRFHIKDILSRFIMKSKLLSKQMRKVDAEIYRSLPEKSKKLLESSVVHFADTNWYNGVHDVHFCFVVNPGNGKLEIWEVSDDGQNLFPADQSVWLNDHEWEIYEPFFLERESTNA